MDCDSPQPSRVAPASHAAGKGTRSDAASRFGSREVLHLYVFWSLGIAQPVFDRLGKNPAVLEDLHIGLSTIWLIVASLSGVIPGLFACGLWVLHRIWPAVSRAVYPVVVYLFSALILAPLICRIDFLSVGFALTGICVAATAATCAYFQWQLVRWFISAWAPAIVGFPLLLLNSPLASYFTAAPQQRIRLENRTPCPVVVIVLDELSGTALQNEQHEIDATRFPNFARLAGTSTWFRQATTVFPDTCQAVPAILSGRYPATKLNPLPADLPQNLFSAFTSTGQYELAIFEPVTRLARKADEGGVPVPHRAIPEAAVLLPIVAKVMAFDLVPDELHRYLPEIPRVWFGVSLKGTVDQNARRGVFRYPWGEDRRGQFDHLLRCLDENDRPSLYFFHVILPHVPWCYLPSGRICLAESDTWELLDSQTFCGQFDGWGDDELYVEQSQQRHLLQLQFTDNQIGRLLDRLQATGLFDKCLLVVTADHGISFRTGDSRRVVTPTNRPDILSVPLFIKRPGQTTGEISDRNVESIDILPTIADIAGIHLPARVDGQSVFEQNAAPRLDKVYHITETLREQPQHVAATVVQESRAPAEIQRRFGAASDPLALFRIGPHPELLGRSVSDFEISRHPGSELQFAEWKTAYDPTGTDLVPCYFQGQVSQAAAATQSVELAVAINGIIQGTTRTYQLTGYRDWFTVMVPETGLRPGENDIRFYELRTAGAAMEFRLCSIRVRPLTD
ncbi:MAG: sulfatase-like hydrolase/transferase [Planctomycetes bacterium]|nr:sulfatase-like hydrolase/transferase [Planctomycetota bacterium]